MRVRTDDGAVFDTGTFHVDSPLWTWVRLEDGTELLVGPQSINKQETIDALNASGDPSPLLLGTAS